jgi:hypothetical protein
MRETRPMTAIKSLIHLFCIFCICLTAPVTAGSKYVAGFPELSASISGTNEYSPGADVQLIIMVENKGVNEYKFVQSGIINRDDQPNTAKSLTVSLESGDSPVVIKSDPQMLGDLKGADSAKAVFSAKIKSDAPGGQYHIPLSLNYTFFTMAEQYGVDTIQYYYTTKNEILLIPVTIKPYVSVDVISAVPEHLNAGTEGFINITIKNTGYDDGSRAVVELLRNGNSPVIPTDSSVYIGDFPSASTVDCRYRVSVAGDAERQTYPVDVVVVYQNKEGDSVTSRSDTVGIPIGGKVEFTVISPPGEINPGNTKVITVRYKNTGDTEVYSAQARIRAVDPFSSNEDTTYIGDLRPGESQEVSYGISADRQATLKEYGLNSEIRYRDALENTYFSDPMKVRITVTPATGLYTILTNPVYLSIVVAFVIGAVYLVFHHRRRTRQ